MRSPSLVSQSLAARVNALRAAGEPTRLRALHLLAQGELSVGELSQALDQSQPRISRHMKLLTSCGLVERTPEASWVFYRLAPEGSAERALCESLLHALDAGDPTLARDGARLLQIRAARAEDAAAYFSAHAPQWDTIRAMHQPEADVESAILDAAGPGPFGVVVDVGCGAGRMLELFAPHSRSLEGFDLSREMLAIARAAAARIPDGRAAVRLGDVYDPPLRAGAADLVVMHQVLHFLADPPRALAQALSLLRPGGRLVLVDFAPHDFEFLRERHAHRRLGFADDEIARWAAQGGSVVRDVRTLPAASGQSLTVKIWVCEVAGAEVARAGVAGRHAA